MPNSSNTPNSATLKNQAIEWLVRLRSGELREEELHEFADWLSAHQTHSVAFDEAEKLFDAMSIAAKLFSVEKTQQTAQMASQPNAFDLSSDKPSPKELARMQEMGSVRGNKNEEKSSILPPLSNLPPQGKAVSSLKSTELASTQKCASTSNPAQSMWLSAFRLLAPASVVMATVWICAVLLIFPENTHFLARWESDYHTQTGELKSIVLSDGSQLLLNTNSAVSVDYNDTIRRINLHHGQARFTVAKDAKRPFEVYVAGLKVRALGTVFQVFVPESEAVSVAVQEHAVAASIVQGNPLPYGPEDTIVIHQGEQVRYHIGSSLPQPEKINLERLTAWQERRLIVSDQPLNELVSELNRYKTGRVFISDDQLKSLHVTGVFSSTNPDAVLSSVCRILNLQQTRLGPWWVVLHR